MIVRRLTPEGWAILLFALARTGLCGFRAATQSLTVDESTTFLEFVRGPWNRMYQNYTPNNHLLYSALAKLCVHWFGVSEFTLRLPSVLAGFFLILGLYRILRLAAPSRMVRWVALVTLGLQPLLLDLCVAARGYGLGAALLVWAMYFAMCKRDLVAGTILGLSVAAMLVMVFPGAGLVGAVFVLTRESLEVRVRRALEIAIPASCVLFLIAYPALRTVTRDQFYVGDPHLGGALMNLAFTTIRTSVTHAGLFGTGEAARAIQFVFLPLIAAFIAAVSIRTLFRRSDLRTTLIPAVTLAVAIPELLAAHVVAGMNYPTDRVAIYLILLFGLAWAIAAAQAPPMPVPALNGILACALALQFATQFETHYFSLWPADLPAKLISRKLQQECAGKRPNSVSVSATWYQVPALEFYRYYYRIDALKPVERHSRTMLDGFDYYVLNLKDDPDVRPNNLDRLVRLSYEPVSGVLFAKQPN